MATTGQEAARPLPVKIMCHGRPTLRLARRFGWLPGARYTNTRDIAGFRKVGLIDIDWRAYDFGRHLAATARHRPLITIARDVERRGDLDRILEQARRLARWAEHVVVVPKDPKLAPDLLSAVPERFLLGYSVPTRYGKTAIGVDSFGRRPVHLLGGRPDVQLQLADKLNVFSLDGNRITLDATYGDYFIGDRFRPHPSGGYYECIRASLRVINAMWRARG